MVGEVEVGVVDPERAARSGRAGRRASGGSAARDAGGCGRARGSRRSWAAAPRRSAPRPRACGCRSSRWSGTRRRSRRACPDAPVPFVATLPRPLTPFCPPGTLVPGVTSSSATTSAGPKRVLLAAPRGYCAGVDRAVQTVEHALDLHGAPIYVRKEIVHNKHVVEQLEKRGAIFVDQETEVPEGEMVVFSRPRRRAERPRQRRGAQPAHDRRHLPAGHQGPRRGEEVRRRRLHDRPDRPRGPRGGRGHDRRGARQHRPGADRGRGRDARGRGPRPRRLHHPDHPLGRRDHRDHRGAEAEVPEHHRAEDRRHLLRDHQPPAGGEGARQASATWSW